MKFSGTADNDNLPHGMRRIVARAVLETYELVWQNVHGNGKGNRFEAITDRRFIQRKREEMFGKGLL